MWLSDKTFRPLAVAATALVAGLALAGCGFTPLYGTSSDRAAIPMSYAAPQTQAEQIIYNELALSFPRTDNPDAPRLNISSSGGNRRIGRSSTGLPTTTQEWTQSATATITQPDPLDPAQTQTIYEGSKSASATYTTNGQRLADQEAAKDAEKRAARAVAQSLRLSIKAALNSRP